MGGLPAHQDGNDWLFVPHADRVAAATMKCLVEGDAGEKAGQKVGVISISDGVPLQELWTSLNSILGSELIPTSRNEWMQKLQKHAEVKMGKPPL